MSASSDRSAFTQITARVIASEIGVWPAVLVQSPSRSRRRSASGGDTLTRQRTNAGCSLSSSTTPAHWSHASQSATDTDAPRSGQNTVCTVVMPPSPPTVSRPRVSRWVMPVSSSLIGSPFLARAARSRAQQSPAGAHRAQHPRTSRTDCVRIRVLDGHTGAKCNRHATAIPGFRLPVRRGISRSVRPGVRAAIHAVVRRAEHRRVVAEHPVRDAQRAEVARRAVSIRGAGARALPVDGCRPWRPTPTPRRRTRVAPWSTCTRKLEPMPCRSGDTAHTPCRQACTRRRPPSAISPGHVHSVDSPGSHSPLASPL